MPPSSPPPDADAGLPLRHVLVIVLLMAAHLACGAWASVSSSDTSRDVFFAQQIASGQSFPLTGPAIYGVLHLGPLWYYLLALPMLVFANGATATGMMGLLSATQFPLAYALGRRLRNRHEGLLFALVLALPGWMVTSFGSLTHPIIAIPSLLLATGFALDYRERPDARRAVMLGIAFALMCTAHPTLVLPAALLAGWCAWRAPGIARGLGHAAIAGLVVLLALAPMLYEQWQTGFADAASTAAYTRNEWRLPTPWDAAELVYAILVYGPLYATRFWFGLSPTPTYALFVLYVVLLLFAVVGLVAGVRRDPARRRIGAALGLALALQSLFLCAIRDTMPPWMIYSLWAMLAALIALGLGHFRASVLARRSIALLLVLTTAWSFAILARLMQGATEFTNMQPSPGRHGFMDVRDYEDRSETVRFARVPFRELFDLDGDRCEPEVLYGHLAWLMDYTYAVAAAHTCGSTAHVQFGGIDPTRTASMGLHRTAWQALGMTPESWRGAIGISRPDAVWHSPVPLYPVVPTFSNFPRPLSREVQTFTVRGRAFAAQAVLVSHRAHRYTGFEVLRARADGQEVLPRHSDITAVMFRAPDPRTATSVDWEIEIRANPEYVDVVVFGGGGVPP
jgi:hypothetical protein